ncbi:MAG: STAS domain-containing protein [Treponema sp.]|jgi:anti-anti-sigma factor|nr:STAS domain-containing protein [Treponema sp.]
MSKNEMVQESEDEPLVLREDMVIKRMDPLEGCLIVHLAGYIDTYNADYFHKRMVTSIEAGHTKLIFQCKELTYVSSTGIGSFSSILKLVTSQGGNMVFFDLQPKVYDVFQLLGFAEVFTIKNTLDASLAVFRDGSSEESKQGYPRSIVCPVCANSLHSVHSGRFRCSVCKTILAIDKQGQIFLG